MDLEKQKRFLIRAAFYGLAAALVYCGLKYLLPVFMPFLLAFLMVWALRRPAKWLAEKSRLPQKWMLVILLVLLYVVLFGLVSLLGVQLFDLIRQTAPKLPALYRDELVPGLKVAADFAERWLARFDPTLVSMAERAFSALSGSIESGLLALSKTVMSWASNVMLGVPAFIIALVVMITASFFLANDYDRVMNFLYSRLPETAKGRLREVWRKLAGSLWIYIRSYTLFLIITFAELALGLWLLKIPYAVTLAAAIAIFDLMPILGTGGILIPWTVIAAVAGEYGMALGVGVLYIVITMVRQYLEPKLVGKQIGLHPLATLIALFVGMELFGLVGLFAFPVTLSVLVQLKRSDEPQ